VQDPRANEPARFVPNPEKIEGLETIGDYLDTYDRGARAWDRSFGELVEWLQARGAFADTVFVVLSDHGEAFFEHGRWSHGFTLYDEMLRVVWMIRSPTLRAARVDRPVSLVDVLPTLNRVAELELDEEVDGVAVLPEPPPGHVVWSERLMRHDETPREVAARCGPYKAVVSADRRTRVYDLRTDPLEHTPLQETAAAADCLDAGERFRRRPVRIASTVTLDAGTQEQLRQLGYWY
jgi:arylsulfatase A-like enzyme